MEFGFDGTILHSFVCKYVFIKNGCRTRALEIKKGEIFGILDLFSNPFLFFVMNIEF